MQQLSSNNSIKNHRLITIISILSLSVVVFIWFSFSSNPLQVNISGSGKKNSTVNLELETSNNKIKLIELNQNIETNSTNYEHEINTTNAAIDTLRQQLITLKQQISVKTNAKIEINSSYIEPATLSTQQRDQLQADYNLRTSDLYTNTLALEQQDPQWSIAAEQKTRQSLIVISDKIEMKSIECKTTLCRLKISKTENTTENDAIQAFKTNIDWPGAMSMTYNSDSGDAVVYMARDGYQLPRLVEDY